MATASIGSTVWLAGRSLFWTLAFPGFFAGYVPWRYFGVGRVQIDPARPRHLAALTLVILASALLVACIVEFARSGRGTLSPADPPRHLVVRGLYRFVRNPMYLSVATLVLGEVLLTGSRGLAWYLAIWFLAVNVFVIGYEEPTLRRQFGPSYDEYTRRVGRWLPRFPDRSDRSGPGPGKI
jgi:protein-S-isoprenylcysteine O-methyltransferase Ste14